MTAEELEKIVARHEMRCLELKESFNVECVETACAFTNAQGGFIVIGVDNDGNPSKRQLRFEGLRDYENKISAKEPEIILKGSKNILEAQSADISLRIALKAALRGSGRDDGDGMVSKLIEVYRKIAEDPRITLSAVAKTTGLSERTIDEYVLILKTCGALRRKDGKRFGAWEALM